MTIAEANIGQTTASDEVRALFDADLCRINENGMPLRPDYLPIGLMQEYDVSDAEVLTCDPLSVMAEHPKPPVLDMFANNAFYGAACKTTLPFYSEVDNNAQTHYSLLQQKTTGMPKLDIGMRDVLMEFKRTGQAEASFLETFNSAANPFNWVVRMYDPLEEEANSFRRSVIESAGTSEVKRTLEIETRGLILPRAVGRVVCKNFKDEHAMSATAIAPEDYFGQIAEYTRHGMYAEIFENLGRDQKVTQLDALINEAVKARMQSVAVRALSNNAPEKPLETVINQAVRELCNGIAFYAVNSLKEDGTQLNTFIVSDDTLRLLWAVFDVSRIKVIAHNMDPKSNNDQFAVFSVNDAVLLTVVPSVVPDSSWLNVEVIKDSLADDDARFVLKSLSEKFTFERAPIFS